MKTKITPNRAGFAQPEITIPVLEYQAQRVVTFAMVDEAHERPKGTSKAAFYRNRSRFMEGRHFFEVSKDVIRTQTFLRAFPAHTKKGILITEMGYLLLVKPFNDDLSWLIQERLVSAYFRHVPQFPELRKVHIPEPGELAAMPLDEAQNRLLRAERESFSQHGQKGSAAMRLRRDELKKLRPALIAIGERSQLELPGIGHV